MPRVYLMKFLDGKVTTKLQEALAYFLPKKDRKDYILKLNITFCVCIFH